MQISEPARLVQGKIDRKIVKQTVMTTVYGVTLIGAKDQIQNRLHETYGEAGSKELDEEQVSCMYDVYNVICRFCAVLTKSRCLVCIMYIIK